MDFLQANFLRHLASLLLFGLPGLTQHTLGADFIFVKTTVFKIGKKAIFQQFLENPSNGINVRLAWVLGIEEDVIKVNNNKYIKFLGQDLVNIALEAGQCVRQPKRYYLILEVAVSSLESRFLFIALFYPYLMVSTYEVKLSELFCLS